MGERPLLRRVKEHHLGRWTIAYLAGAFAALQLLDVLVDPLGFSVAAQRVVLAIVALGLPVTLVLAWYHGEQGRQRVSGPEFVILSALLLIAGGVLSLVGSGPAEEETGASGSGVIVGDDGRPGIAVLPCQSLSPDPGDQYFADGVHDEILLKLAGISGLRSIGRESLRWYRDNPRPPRQMAQELNVGFVGSCSVRSDPDGERIRVTFQLVDADTDNQVWGQSYDESLSVRSLLDIHSDIAQRVAQAVEAELTPEERQRLEAPSTSDLTAYDLFLRGSQLNDRATEAELRRAVGYFQQALAVDSTFARAYTALAHSYIRLGLFFLPPDDVFPSARAAAEKALALHPGLSEALVALAFIDTEYTWDWAAAEERYRTAVRTNPGASDSHQWYQNLLRILGRCGEAIDHGTTAAALNPLSAVVAQDLGYTLYYCRQYPRAVEELERAVRLEPRFALALMRLGMAYEQLEAHDLAVEAAEQAVALSDSSLIMMSTLGRVYASAGRTDDARDVLRLLQDRTEGREHLDGVYMASLLTGLGQHDKALEWLSRALEQRSPSLVSLAVHPWHDPIRDRPEFEDIVRDLGLSGAAIRAH